MLYFYHSTLSNLLNSILYETVENCVILYYNDDARLSKILLMTTTPLYSCTCLFYGIFFGERFGATIGYRPLILLIIVLC